MGVFFGTDGLRGEYGKELTIDIAYRCGRALALQKQKAKILIGRDTRSSGQILTLAFAIGAICEGAQIVDVSICPTAGISYLTSIKGFDFGVVISASHNEAKYNGIKIFDNAGKKLGDKRENELERKFFILKDISYCKNIGNYKLQSELVKEYKKFLEDNCKKINGIKVVLDCANGASFCIAPQVFKSCGADVIAINDKPNGININKNCGALNLEKLRDKVLKEKADMGFAFDGDSDRVIAIDEKGNIVDGDKILYLFATQYKNKEKLKKNTIVGTKMTNLGVEKALSCEGINLIRTDVGDKYVGEELEKNELLIGGEQCGHIFLKDRLATGDGVLNALLIAEICKNNNKYLSQYFTFKNYSQVMKNVKVQKKNIVLECNKLQNLLKKLQINLNNNGRIVVRASGTEPLIRIMVESIDYEVAEKYATEIENKIKKLDKEL